MEQKQPLQEAQSAQNERPQEALIPYLDRLYGFVRRELRYYEDLGLLNPGEVRAEDVVDDVVARAVQLWAQRPPHLLPWLYRLALHRLRQIARAARERPDRTVRLELPAPLHELPEEADQELWEFYQPDDVVTWEDVLPDEHAPDPEEIELQQEALEQIEAVINRLPARQREAFILDTLEGLTPEEIARTLGVEEEQVRAWLREARERLRRAVTEVAGPEAIAAITE